MDRSEFLLLIPGILYGIAIVDLLKIYRHPSKYWEPMLWGFLLFMDILADWLRLYNQLDIMSSSNYLYPLYLIMPLIYTQACFVLTPELHHHDTKQYFQARRRSFFILIGAGLLLNLIGGFYIYSDDRTWMRLILIPFLAYNIFRDSIIARSILAALVIINMIVIFSLNLF